MEPGFRSPLLDLFKRGEVARDVRLQAARAELAPRAYEQVAVLMLLTGDDDPEIASAAQATLARIPRESLQAFIGRADVPDEVRAFFVARGIDPAPGEPIDVEAPLLDLGPEPEPPDAVQPPSPAAADQATASPEAEDDKKVSITQKISGLSVAQRMSLAMKGSREERSILIRDPNKLVSTSVLASPKVTEAEIESIAKMANVSEEILRIIGTNRAWVKNYNVMLALVRNPKSPVPMAMNFLNRLNDRDLRQLSTNRNVAEILRITARKKVVIEK